jgi:hypothetical protein
LLIVVGFVLYGTCGIQQPLFLLITASTVSIMPFMINQIQSIAIGGRNTIFFSRDRVIPANKISAIGKVIAALLKNAIERLHRFARFPWWLARIHRHS